MLHHVAAQDVASGEAALAHTAFERPFAGVVREMPVEMLLPQERL